MFLTKRRKIVSQKVNRKIFPVRSGYLVLTKENLFWIALFLFCCSLIGWLLFGDVFSLKRVECQRDGISCDEQIVAELNKNLGSSLLRLSPNRLENKLL